MIKQLLNLCPLLSALLLSVAFQFFILSSVSICGGWKNGYCVKTEADRSALREVARLSETSPLAFHLIQSEELNQMQPKVLVRERPAQVFTPCHPPTLSDPVKASGGEKAAVLSEKEAVNRCNLDSAHTLTLTTTAVPPCGHYLDQGTQQ